MRRAGICRRASTVQDQPEPTPYKSQAAGRAQIIAPSNHTARGEPHPFLKGGAFRSERRLGPSRTMAREGRAGDCSADRDCTTEGEREPAIDPPNEITRSPTCERVSPTKLAAQLR